MVLTNSVDKPRIISELKKTCMSKMKLKATTSLLDINKPNISGELLWSVTPSEWHLRMAEVRQGCLYLYKHGSRGLEFRLPLRHLNLKPCSTPRSFRFSEGQGIPLATFQALTEEDYERWVRTLAVELLRQTPLQDVRFLDIIGITRRRERERSHVALRRGRSEECISNTAHVTWKEESEVEFVRGGRYRSFTRDTLPGDMPAEPRNNKVHRNKYNFKEEHKRRDKHETGGEQVEMANIKIRRAHRGRPKIPFEENWTLQEAPRASWGRTQSMDSLRQVGASTTKICTCNAIKKNPPIVSDESGISSGDENNNTSDNSAKHTHPENFTFVSVREKKKFFESLSSDGTEKPIQNRCLTRSSSIGNVNNEQEGGTLTLRRRKRAKSLHDLDRHNVPVREMCRMFEHTEEELQEERQVTPEAEIEETQQIQQREQQNEQPDKSATNLLNQRRLQRGERKLGKLRIQIAEVEDTIKIIADDLNSIGRNTLKRHEGLEIFAALQRRLQEENSRLERLQEETIRVIKDNQRIIAKLEKASLK